MGGWEQGKEPRYVKTEKYFFYKKSAFFPRYNSKKKPMTKIEFDLKMLMGFMYLPEETVYGKGVSC